MIGFETTGNATLILYDGDPVLATDPWISGDAYFGSWTLSHAIADEQRENILRSRYIWFSHGHPDHLNEHSLGLFRERTILLADHFGERIKRSLESAGFRVEILKDRRWYPISKNIRICSIADQNHDSILLAEIRGKLVVNLNDADDPAWIPFVRKVVKHYSVSFLLKAEGFGDADMLNFCDEDGNRILRRSFLKSALGVKIKRSLSLYGATYFVPFASAHIYQRKDSIWANDFRPSQEEFLIGFDLERSRLLDPNVRYNAVSHQIDQLNPPANPPRVVEPKDFGDDWTEQLEREESLLARNYIRSFHHLPTHFSFINFRIGKRDNIVELRKRRFRRGLTFEAPRHSFVKALSYEIFDDLLIGNFMKTIVHGYWNPRELENLSPLYPHFTPYVTKYGDNGGAKSRYDLIRHAGYYFSKNPVDNLCLWFKKAFSYEALRREDDRKAAYECLLPWCGPMRISPIIAKGMTS